MPQLQPIYETVECDLKGFEGVKVTYDVAVPYNLIEKYANKPFVLAKLTKLKIENWNITVKVEEPETKVNEETGEEEDIWVEKEITLPVPTVENKLEGATGSFITWLFYNGYQKAVAQAAFPRKAKK